MPRPHIACNIYVKKVTANKKYGFVSGGLLKQTKANLNRVREIEIS